MKSLKADAVEIISKLPENSSVDDIMYRLYVLDKVRKGQQAVEDGDIITSDELKEEIKSW